MVTIYTDVVNQSTTNVSDQERLVYSVRLNIMIYSECNGLSTSCSALHCIHPDTLHMDTKLKIAYIQLILRWITERKGRKFTGDITDKLNLKNPIGDDEQYSVW